MFLTGVSRVLKKDSNRFMKENTSMTSVQRDFRKSSMKWIGYLPKKERDQFTAFGPGMPNAVNSLYIGDPNFYEEIRNLREEKFKFMKKYDTKFENYKTDNADYIFVAYGTPARIAKESVDIARDNGMNVGLFRPITLSPFPSAQLYRHAKTAKGFLTVELNNGQMIEDVRLAANGRAPVHFYGRSGGNYPNELELLNEIKAIGGKK